MAPETCTLQGCFFHWWKFSCCHLAKVSLPSYLLVMPVLQVLSPPLFIAGNSINHISFCISVTRITSLSLVSLTLLVDASLFWMAVLVKNEHFWSLKLFNSVVILQFKWQAMRVQSPIISSLFPVVHAFSVWKAVGSWMWNEENNSQCLAGGVHKMSKPPYKSVPNCRKLTFKATALETCVGSSLTCIFKNQVVFQFLCCDRSIVLRSFTSVT